MFKDSILTSGSIFKLDGEEATKSAEILFTRLVLISDDRGRFVASPANILSSCFPIIANSCGLDVERYIKHLQRVADNLRQIVDIETIKLYENCGIIYGFFPNWRNYQRLRFVNPKHPPPPKELCNDPDMLTPCGHSADSSPQSADNLRLQVKDQVQVKVKEEDKKDCRDSKKPKSENWDFENSIIGAYHEILPELSKIQGPKRIDKVLKKIRHYTKVYEKTEKYFPEPLDLFGWRRVFSDIRHSDLLMGRSTEWKADLGWIVDADRKTTTNFEKIMSGGYLDKKKKQQQALREHPNFAGYKS
jgi:hypothetical protein